VVQALGHLISSLTYVFGSVSKKPRSVLAPKVPTYFAGGEFAGLWLSEVWAQEASKMFDAKDAMKRSFYCPFLTS